MECEKKKYLIGISVLLSLFLITLIPFFFLEFFVYMPTLFFQYF